MSSHAFRGPSSVFGHLVSDHGRQPVAKSSSTWIILVEIALLEDRKHYVLDHLFGCVIRAATLSCQDVQQRPVNTKELGPRELIRTVPQAFQECGPRFDIHDLILSANGKFFNRVRLFSCTRRISVCKASGQAGVEQVDSCR